MRKLLFLLGLLIFQAACTPKEEQTILPVHETQTQLWQGQYSGHLPCADCAYIQMDLTLLPENFYRMRIQKVDSIQWPARMEEGRFFWRPDGLIQLDEKGDRMVFFIGNQGRLEMRGNDGRAYPNSQGKVCGLDKQ